MSSVIAYTVLAIGAVVLVFVGYHFTVRTLRIVTGVFVVTVVVLVTRYGVMHSSGASADLVSSFARGADGLAAVLARPVLSGRPVPVPGRIGWLVVVAVLVFVYRELEAWAMHWQPPNVDMSALGGGQPRGFYRRKEWCHRQWPRRCDHPLVWDGVAGSLPVPGPGVG
jgi:hypothetical protein